MAGEFIQQFISIGDNGFHNDNCILQNKESITTRYNSGNQDGLYGTNRRTTI